MDRVAPANDAIWTSYTTFPDAFVHAELAASGYHCLVGIDRDGEVSYGLEPCPPECDCCFGGIHFADSDENAQVMGRWIPQSERGDHGGLLWHYIPGFTSSPP